mmetsp:Transcript_62032/g.133779  ORF Transcript_62032/g.133779 Transcript_62032/m.133779 type:complete len:320 (+) Transcript_62032:87-1046(+)|eukprot:CAMPEP_0204271038 /NCGR_PEP_ID=MMETSP0468-20130131/19227_1 /ASSEMBLY_ACC=CAM_ASM_000383 /TAXON_ID=2969 /ORGANISM="Oxyrrhis marina" /LENGTH=319 /DNA_ID=CAMNT_0051246643 /DNA_START=72 /DNA_END=1031 /DNA_ORIENTATION=-
MPRGWKKPTLGDAIAGTSIKGMEVSVTLANPALEDCPLIGCSAGFTTITGYSRHEIVGRNCRFLNEGCEMAPDVRTKLRRSAIAGEEFVGVLVNRRKDGSPFQNLLHMTRIKVGNQSFIVGIQADVTGQDLDVAMEGHKKEVQEVVDKLFKANINAWVKVQGNLFHGTMATPGGAPLSQQRALAAPNNFVQVDSIASDANAAGAVAGGPAPHDTIHNPFLDDPPEAPGGDALATMRITDSLANVLTADGGDGVGEVPVGDFFKAMENTAMEDKFGAGGLEAFQKAMEIGDNLNGYTQPAKPAAQAEGTLRVADLFGIKM